jgi:flagellar biosynthesis component FlhA
MSSTPGLDRDLPAGQPDLFNVREFVTVVGNNAASHSLCGLIGSLTEQVSQDLRQEFVDEEAAVRQALAVSKLDDLVTYICRRQVLKIQQINQLRYEKELLVKVMEQRRQSAGKPAQMIESTSLGEPLSRRYCVSVLDML